MSEGFDQDLTNAVEVLSHDIADLKNQLRINRNWRTALITLSALKVVTFIVLGVIIANLSDTQHREQITRSRVLCPLYSLFVKSVDAPRSPGETSDQYDQRVSAREQIHDSYAALGCR
jgi:hypothetical protein